MNLKAEYYCLYRDEHGVVRRMERIPDPADTASEQLADLLADRREVRA